MTSDKFKRELAREAMRLHVPMSHAVKDSEFMPVLSYRVDQEIESTRQRLADLKALRDRYSA